MPNLAERPMFPVNAVGPKGEHAFVGVSKTFFTGTTGLVATTYGIPGMVVSRIRTGYYQVNHDPAFELDPFPSLQCPSGTVLQANVVADTQNSLSGYFEVVITQDRTLTIPTTLPATNITQPVNPPSGTVLRIQVFGAPITRY